MRKILFINYKGQRCGVYQYGMHVYDAIRSLPNYAFSYHECESKEELVNLIKHEDPEGVIYNYHAPLLPFISKELLTQLYGPVHICLAHELSKQQLDKLDDSFFHYYLFADPSIKENTPYLMKLPRLIPYYENHYPLPSIPTIGSYGFGSKIKGFEKLVMYVQKELDEALIRINIPSNTYFDKNGTLAKQIASGLKDLIYKKGIRLEVTHYFFTDKELLDFLAQNTVNIFLYDPSQQIHGIASATDAAIAVKRAIAVSESTLFRHLFHLEPSIVISYENAFFKRLKNFFKKPSFTSLEKIIQNGTKPLKTLYQEWSKEAFQKKMQEALETIFKNRKKIDRKFNRILDNSAREEYEPVIQTLFKYCPQTMSRKIPRAHVQQAFVLDAVRHLASYDSKILSVGAFEDTACETLMKMGYDIEAIDPAINEDLDSFYEKSIQQGIKFDLIFSTSVIEHVSDDITFIKKMSELLQPGGKGIITCDFKDNWTPQEGIFPGSFRFYTQDYLRNEVMQSLRDCKLIDEPSWDCPEPDFEYGGKKYTFASLVFEKQ